jgi:hypothetical protein
MGVRHREGGSESEVREWSPQQSRGDWACWRRHGVSKGGMQCHSHLGSKCAAEHSLVCVLQDIHVNLVDPRRRLVGGVHKRGPDSRQQEVWQEPWGVQCSGHDRRRRCHLGV